MGRCAHRHDFEELFTLPEGELEFTFRRRKPFAPGRPSIFRPTPRTCSRTSPQRWRVCSACARVFPGRGFPVASRASPPPQASDEEIAEKHKLLAMLLPKYRTEMVAPRRAPRSVATLVRSASEPKAFALTRNSEEAQNLAWMLE